MAMASQNQDYYPDPNMGMSGLYGNRWNPMSARSALDRYFRAYWSQKHQAAGAREALNIKAKIAADERAFRGKESAADRAFKASESALDLANKAKMNELQRGWGQEDSEKKAKYSWLGALANAGTIFAGYDQRYNNSAMTKGIIDAGKSLFNFDTAVNKKRAAYGIPVDYTLGLPEGY